MTSYKKAPLYPQHPQRDKKTTKPITMRKMTSDLKRDVIKPIGVLEM